MVPWRVERRRAEPARGVARRRAGAARGQDQGSTPRRGQQKFRIRFVHLFRGGERRLAVLLDEQDDHALPNVGYPTTIRT